MKVRDTSGREVKQEELNMGSHKVINVTDPASAQDADTKAARDAALAAGFDLASGKDIKIYQALGTDHTWSGLLADFTAGESLAIGDATYFKSDGKMWKADADETTTMPCTALATATINANATGEFLLGGFMRDDSWAWTVGGYLFVHTTGGNPTQTQPAASGDQVQKLGIATHADRLYFKPDLTICEVE